MEDRGVIFTNISAPDGSTLEYTDRYLRVVEKAAMDTPELDRIFMFAGNPA